MPHTLTADPAAAPAGARLFDAAAAASQVQFLRCIDRSRLATRPYRHWFLSDVLTPDAATAIAALPFEPPHIGDTLGKRETHNSSRTFFSVENRARFPVCDALAQALQNCAVIDALEKTCNVELAGSYLRIEYCQDTDGFWLEHHTDIGAKLFTMLIYLSSGPGAEQWGTDIMDAHGNVVATSPAVFNSGLIFIPGADTWHGFHKRPIAGVRKTLIVNYVKSEWRSRHELAYPDRPI